MEESIGSIGMIIIYLIVGGVFVFVGLRFILQYKKIVKAALTNQNIFAKEIEDKKIEKSPTVIKFNYIMICFMGAVFTIGGLVSIVKALMMIV